MSVSVHSYHHVGWLCVSVIILTIIHADEARTIVASGGGVVKIGQDLVLTYKVTEAYLGDPDNGPWERCYWYW